MWPELRFGTFRRTGQATTSLYVQLPSIFSRSTAPEVLPILIRLILCHRPSMHAPLLSPLQYVLPWYHPPNQLLPKLDVKMLVLPRLRRTYMRNTSCNRTFCDAAVTRSACFLQSWSPFGNSFFHHVLYLDLTTGLRVQLLAPYRLQRLKSFWFCLQPDLNHWPWLWGYGSLTIKLWDPHPHISLYSRPPI